MKILFQRILESLRNLSKKQIIGLIAILVILAATPLTIFIAQKRQEIRQHASSDPVTVYFADCTTNAANSSILTGPWAITLGSQPVLCLYIQTNDTSLNLLGFDIQMNYDTGLNLNSITIQSGGLEFNTQQINTYNNTTHSFEIERVSAKPGSIINGTLLIATLNFTPQTGSGTINYTNLASSIIALNHTGYLTVGWTPLAYTISQTPTSTPIPTPTPTPILTPTPTPIPVAADFNRDGSVNCVDYKLWKMAFGNQLGPQAADGSFTAGGFTYDNLTYPGGKFWPDVTNDTGLPDLEDFNVWYTAYENLSSHPVCPN